MLTDQGTPRRVDRKRLGGQPIGIEEVDSRLEAVFRQTGLAPGALEPYR